MHSPTGRDKKEVPITGRESFIHLSTYPTRTINPYQPPGTKSIKSQSKELGNGNPHFAVLKLNENRGYTTRKDKGSSIPSSNSVRGCLVRRRKGSVLKRESAYPAWNTNSVAIAETLYNRAIDYRSGVYSVLRKCQRHPMDSTVTSRIPTIVDDNTSNILDRQRSSNKTAR